MADESDDGIMAEFVRRVNERDTEHNNLADDSNGDDLTDDGNREYNEATVTKSLEGGERDGRKNQLRYEVSYNVSGYEDAKETNIHSNATHQGGENRRRERRNSKEVDRGTGTKTVNSLAVEDADNDNTRYNLAEENTYAPAFYSLMSKVIDEMKQNKIGASDVISHLKNRGVLDEEIKWSGIEDFLDGKKSVTKAELHGVDSFTEKQFDDLIKEYSMCVGGQLVEIHSPKDMIFQTFLRLM